MVDGADADTWSGLADGWSRYWGASTAPVHEVLIQAAGIRGGMRVLDVGCGSGEFLARLVADGVLVAGVDPAPGMVELARRRVPGGQVHPGDAEDIPFEDNSFEVVTAVNALQFAAYPFDALDEWARVLVQGGMVAVANWAEGARNDLDVLERAVADAAGEPLAPDGELRRPGGLENVLAEAGLEVLAAGIIATPWQPADDHDLVHGVLLGEFEGTMSDRAPVVLAAAAPFRRPDGGYLLHNHHRWAVARHVI
ncbi:methyltransferase domain-containing protein [Nakamurella sp. YIM 132087]|uniref:Methyltransferase domain-containing protein n=1 Tax=Nakamurella alba TaxID=2665158 RepID=A0A7K1FGX9_9ACTN|nr:class I SAM-dependent methyltransferase [Nakamurella alba]MTD13330.1 methyltransferase domain-containing protein [Nakamurella alba]